MRAFWYPRGAAEAAIQKLDFQTYLTRIPVCRCFSGRTSYLEALQCRPEKLPNASSQEESEQRDSQAAATLANFEVGKL